METTARAPIDVRTAVLALLLLLGLTAPGTADGATTYRVSISSTGVEGTLGAGFQAVSSDARILAFSSYSANLVPGDTNGREDVFVRDRKTHRTVRVSVGSGGVQANGDSRICAISRSGRFVVFESSATNLVTGDGNGVADVFVRDRKTHRTTRISVSTAGGEGDEASATGVISGGGRFVVFSSGATNLVGGDTNGVWDVFVRDRREKKTTRISVSSSGAQSNADVGNSSISADGRFVAFETTASTLIASDGNIYSDIFVRDRRRRTTTRVSVSRTGGAPNQGSFGPSISDDARVVAYYSYASNLVRGDANTTLDVYARDRQTRRNERLSRNAAGAGANFASESPSVSGSGRFVAFNSDASNLVPRDTNGSGDVFLFDRRLDRIRRVSVTAGNRQANASSFYPELSADARFVAFGSHATNLVPGDTNGTPDVFIRGRLR